MIIKRKSVYSGVVRSRNIEVNPRDYEMWEKGYMSLSDAMGYLDQDDRDFILSGITNEEWKTMWREEINNIVMDNV